MLIAAPVTANNRGPVATAEPVRAAADAKLVPKKYVVTELKAA